MLSALRGLLGRSIEGTRSRTDASIHARRRTAAALAAIFAIGLGLRLHVALGCAGPPKSDMAEYDTLAARAWAPSGPSPTEVSRPAAYPLLLGGIYRVAGHRTQPVYIVQALLGTVACLLVVGACRACGQPWSVALVAGAAVAVSNDLAMYAGLLVSENLFLPLAIAGLWVLASVDEALPHGRAASRLLLGGLCLGLGAATRSAGLALVAAATLWAAGRGPAVRDRLGAACRVAGGAALALLIVGAAGFGAWGSWVLLDPHTALNLWLSNNPEATGLYSVPANVPPHAARAALWFVAEHPREFAELCLRRVASLLRWEADDLAVYAVHPWPEPVAFAVDRLLFALACGLAAVGVLASRSDVRARLPALTVLAQVALLAVTFVVARFRNALLPFLWILAGAGLTQIMTWRGAGAIRRWRAGTAAAAGLSALVWTVAGIASGWGEVTLLSGNLDKGPPDPTVRVLFPRRDGLSPDAEMHPSGTGSVETELFDGLRTGSGDPSWECVLWRNPSPYRPCRARFLLDLGRVARVERVFAFTVSPYGDHRIDRIEILASEDGATFHPAGFAVNDRPQEAAGAFALTIRTRGREARYLEVVLSQSNGSGSAMELCEVYVYGRRALGGLAASGPG